LFNPISQNFSAIRGFSFSQTISLVSGVYNVTPEIPINLTGCVANMQIGPWLGLTSASGTVYGGLTLGGESGQLNITISGAGTNLLYSPSPYYLGISFPTGDSAVLMNGIINTVGPFTNPPPLPSPIATNVPSGGNITIGIQNFLDFQPD